MVLLNHSISGTCYFLDAQLRDIPRSSISAHSGSNSLSSCMWGVFKPCCRYSFLTCLIPSSVFFTFQVLIMLPVANIMFRYIVFMNPMLLMCMRSQNSVTFLYLSRTPLGAFGTIIGSTCWTLLQTYMGITRSLLPHNHVKIPLPLLGGNFLGNFARLY